MVCQGLNRLSYKTVGLVILITERRQPECYNKTNNLHLLLNINISTKTKEIAVKSAGLYIN